MTEKEKAAETMRTTKQIRTKSGFECELSPILLDDWELIHLGRQAQNGGNAAVDYIDYVLDRFGIGKELVEHLRGENGVVPYARLVEEIEEIVGELQTPS